MPRTNLGSVEGGSVKINNTAIDNITGGNGIDFDQEGSSASLSIDFDVIQEKISGETGQYLGFDANGNAVPVGVGHELYGFELQMDETEPSNMIRYIEDNASFASAHMDYTNGVFNYGDWANAFFIKNLKPCMLNYDGTVAYDLDKNDYTKKADGTASDVANSSFAGNAMMGIPTIWVKVDTTNARKPKFYFSNKQLDANFKCYAHHDNNGDVMPYTYMNIYDVWSDGTRYRSISGKSPKNTVFNPSTMIPHARANNQSAHAIWDMGKFVDHQLMNLLLMLIAKSTNFTEVFGNGNTTGYLSSGGTPAAGSDSGFLYSGTLDNKGLFFGYSTSQATNLSMKVFGMENWWENGAKEIIGLISGNINSSSGKYQYKLTYGTEDGSSATGFDVENINPTVGVSGWNNVEGVDYGLNGYVSDVVVGEYGMLPKSIGATSSTKYCSHSVGREIAFIYYSFADRQFAGMAYSIWQTVDSQDTYSYRYGSLSCKPYEKKPEVYGFQLDMDKSVPSEMISYLGDNAAYTPAGMDFTNGVFDYGDWGDAFFIKNLKPCMLNYDGSVAYDLDKNDYTKKADGSASDVANSSFAGNAMMGIPTVWVKVDTSVSRKPKFYFSDKQLDPSYKCYAHHDNNGNVMPYTYISLYNGWIDGNSKLRSISGKVPTRNKSGNEFVTSGRSNNLTESSIWDISKFVDSELINLLLLLITKNTDGQTAIGYGNGNGVNDHAAGSDSTGKLSSGTLDDKGLFFGYSESQAKNLAVKVFGIENWWLNLFNIEIGVILHQGVYYYKLTYGTEDGSSATGFDLSVMTKNAGAPAGWINTGLGMSGGTKPWGEEYYYGTASDMHVGDFGLLTKSLDGTSETKFCDFCNQRKSIHAVCLTAAHAGSNKDGGPFARFFADALDDLSTDTVNARLSCKPTVAV